MATITDHIDTSFDGYRSIIKKSVWNLLVGYSSSGQNSFFMSLKVPKYDIFVKEYHGSFDKLIDECINVSYSEIIEEIDNFNQERTEYINSEDYNYDEDEEEEAIYELFTIVTNIASCKLGGLEHLYIERLEDITTDLKELFKNKIVRDNR